MTQVEEAIYNYLMAYNSIYKKLPTNKELAYQFDRDLTVINKHIQSLIKQGKLERVVEVQWYKIVS